MAGMRRKQVYLERKGGHIEGNKLPRTLEIRIYYVFVLTIEIKNLFYYHYPLLDDIEYIYIYI